MPAHRPHPGPKRTRNSVETIVFAVVGIALYFFSDFVLRSLERYLGRRLENRSLIFFGILLFSALVSFAAIRRFIAG